MGEEEGERGESAAVGGAGGEREGEGLGLGERGNGRRECEAHATSPHTLNNATPR